MSAAKTVLLASPLALEAYAKELGKKACEGEIYGLVGDLGAGKTTFVRGFASGMGLSNAEVSSPTFSILQTYTAPDTINLHHFDAYRLNEQLEWYDLGFDELIQMSGIALIEWANRLVEVLPSDTKWLHFVYEQDGEARSVRQITLAEVKALNENLST